MSRPYTRDLTFRSVNLGKDATLVLTFDRQVEGLYKEKFPVIWKSFKFPNLGIYSSTVTYDSQLGFLKPVVRSDEIVGNVAYQPLNDRQETRLLKIDGRYVFTNPEALVDDGLEVINDTPNKEDIALGFGFFNQSPTPVYYWNSDAFLPRESIRTEFSPVLRAYVVNGYEENQIIREEIPSPCIFEKDLSKLNEYTVWVLYYNAITKKYSISAGVI